jgi:BASS family bile acid:Na+ symporter
VTARPSPASRVAAGIEDHLLALVLLSVGTGLAVPAVGQLAPLSTPILAVMIGSISLTLSVADFRAVRPRALATILVVQTSMPLVAYAVARLLGLSPALTVGFVLLGAVTPELVAPVMTELAGGDTALSTTALVAVGVGTLGLVPAATTAVAGSGVAVDTGRIVEGLLLAVVLPMLTAVAARHRFPERVGRYDDLYPGVSALMVVLVIGIVTGANADVVRGGGPLLAVVVGAVVLNGYGYAAGWLAGTRFPRGERIAATLSVGTRDFAVAAGLVLAAGLPRLAALPAVAFGVLEMASSAWLARRFRTGSDGRAPAG